MLYNHKEAHKGLARATICGRMLDLTAIEKEPKHLDMSCPGFACYLRIRSEGSAFLSSGACMRAGKPSAGKLGKFLVQAQFQGSVHSSALFLTAAAQNLLCMKLATELGVAIPNPWVTWFRGALVPAALGLLVTPLLMFKVRAPLAPASLTAV